MTYYISIIWQFKSCSSTATQTTTCWASEFGATATSGDCVPSVAVSIAPEVATGEMVTAIALDRDSGGEKSPSFVPADLNCCAARVNAGLLLRNLI